jgi:hypothetical protein
LGALFGAIPLLRRGWPFLVFLLKRHDYPKTFWPMALLLMLDGLLFTLISAAALDLGPVRRDRFPCWYAF